MSRARLCEVLSSVSSCEVTENDFLISEPMKVSGAVTSVKVSPRNSLRSIGSQIVKYTRFDLANFELESIVWKGETTLSQLLKRPEFPAAIGYRILNRRLPGRSSLRMLRLTEDDVENVSIFVSGSSSKVTIRAKESSDFFVGEKTINLTLVS